jgi:two-component system, cell cycle response regulator
VLICSGSDEVARLLSELCKNERLEVRIAREPETLLRQAAAWEPDLVLLDDVVDGVSSLELCGEIRASEGLRHTPLMLVSRAAPIPMLTAAGLLAGADDCTSLDAAWHAELRARIHVQLRNRRYRHAIVRLRNERNQLRTRASKDSLTGALGRRALEEAVQAEYKAGSPFAVLFVDIDHFKKVNDTYGHQIGDFVLREVALTLQEGRRGTDVCGRYGGEEFVMVLRQVNPQQATMAAERHRERVRALTFEEDGGPQRVTVSIGVAAFDPAKPDETAYVLLRRADLALYEAKRTGRDRVVLAESYSTEMNGSGRAMPQGRVR